MKDTVLGGNVSQTLFDQNMFNVKGNLTSKMVANIKSIAELPSLETPDDEMTKLTPTYLKQARMSTWYQDNPWTILNEAKKYGIDETLGGPVDESQPPGYRPGNVKKQRTREGFANTTQRRENFANDDEYSDGVSLEDTISPISTHYPMPTTMGPVMPSTQTESSAFQNAINFFQSINGMILVAILLIAIGYYFATKNNDSY